MKRLLLGLACISLLGPGIAGAATDWWPVDEQGSDAGATPTVTLEASDHDSTTLTFELAGLWLEDDVVEGLPVVAVTTPQAGELRELGRPALPTISRLLAVPADARVWVELVDVDEVWLDTPPVRPARPHPTRQPDQVPYLLDEPLYASHTLWPSAQVVVEQPQTIRGLAVSRLEIRAARYDFDTRQLGVLRSATIRIHHEGLAPIPDPDELDSVAYSQLLTDQVFNYELPPNGVPAVPESMLVVSEEALLSAIEPWVEWKRLRGMQVEVVTLEEVGGTLEGVQGTITEAYSQMDPPVTHVVLVGDNIPYYTGQYDGCASDYLFSDLEGNLIPEVLISRVVGANVDEVATQINKFIRYEKEPPRGADAAWLGRATGAATNEAGGGPTDEQRFDAIAVSLENNGYTHVDKFYVTDGSGTATNVQTAIDDGRGWLVYLGHGSGVDFSSLMPPYSISHVAQQSNAGMWPLVTDCSCLNGGFQVPGQDSMDEALMKHGTPDNPMGALGVFGSSTSTSWDPAGEIAEGFTYGFLDHDHAIWGASALYARSHVFEIYGSGMDSEWLFEQWVLFGDSSLMMRSRIPDEPVVVYDLGFPMSASEFVVSVTVDEEPLQNATVALHKAGEWDLVALTDAAGEASFTLTPAAKGPMDVVVTGRDLVPHIGVSEAGAPAGGPGAGGLGCGAAVSPFNFNPAGAGFTASLSPASPLVSGGVLGLLGLAAMIRLRQRR